MKSSSILIKIFLILAITVSAILFSASFLMQDEVGDMILNSLNKRISVKLKADSFKLSFLRKFPKASLELKDVIIYSSADFDKSEFDGINTDTLLIAKSVMVDFRITDIINGRYNMETITAREGKFSFYVDTTGAVNYDISAKSDSRGNETFIIDLQKVILHDIKADYLNLAKSLKIKGLINEGKIKSRISGKNIDFTAVTDMEINHFQIYNTQINHTVNAGLDLILESSEDGIRFRKSSLAIENFGFGLEGFISSDNILDLKIIGNKVDIARIKKYLPGKTFNKVVRYDPEGIMMIECTIKGPVSRKINPHIEITASLRGGNIGYRQSDFAINDLSFEGYFTNGSGNIPGTSSVSLSDLKIGIGSSNYTGSLHISNFESPETRLSLKGELFPREIKDFFDIDAISEASGSVDIDLDLVTRYWPRDSVTLNDVINLKPSARMVFKSFTLGIRKNKALFSDVNGILAVSDTYRSENLSFEYMGQKIRINGVFRNMPGWITGKPVQLVAAADISFNRFIPDVFLKSSDEKTGFNLPGNIILDLNFEIGSFEYKKFSSAGIKGTLNYKPGILSFSSLDMKSLDGFISGKGFIIQNKNKSFVSKGEFNISGIDVYKAFKTFNNFGQNFIIAENLSGNVSGSVSVLLPMDSNFKPLVNAVSAEGSYNLSDGALINFEPVKQLSKFIELSELENIQFQNIENDFFIRNSVLYIPQMDVRSSAADLSVNGQHSFDNNYEYHVRMLLSQILSKKRGKTGKAVSQFGIVQDDGLGRTSILLKIEDKGNDVKVGYDLKAATAGIKNNIKAEKQALKTILKEEYGRTKADPVVKQPASVKKQRFNIVFEETDSVK